MQVSIEPTGTLGRRMTVELPLEKIDEEVARRLAAMSRSVRLKGFRPGKAPLKIVKQQFGSKVLQEVLSDFMRSSYQDAIAQQKLRPAGGPNIRPEPMDTGQGLRYVAEFEVLPEFELADLKDVEIKRPVAEVTEADVDTMMESLRKQRALWQASSEPAKSGDRIAVDYVGTVNGEGFANNTATDFTVEIGAKRWLETFENQLVGLSVGDQRSIEVQYPEESQPAELAGKLVRFDITVKSVSTPVLPPLDEAFANQFGIRDGGVTALRQEVRANMERELRQRTSTALRDRVMKLLLDRHTVEVPQVMIREEANRLRWSTQQSGGEKLLASIPAETIESEAKRRAGLGLVVGEIIRRNDIKLDTVRLRENIEAVAASYEEPAKVVEYYQSNPSARASLDTLTLEQQVVDWVLGQGKVVEEPSSFDEIVNGKRR